MAMYNPLHPGEFINEVYLKPFNVDYRLVAEKLKVSPTSFYRLLKGQTRLSCEMALRLSITLGRTPESWLIMQDNYDLWRAKQKVDLVGVEKLVLV
jgi:addiction module HigA family antidote